MLEEEKKGGREEEKRGLSICCLWPCNAARQRFLVGDRQAQSSTGGSSKLLQRQPRALPVEVTATLEGVLKVRTLAQPISDEFEFPD